MFKKIISGGQTGVDQGALDFAIENNIPHGGWMPKGRKAENGVIPIRYQLKETTSSGYPQRTKKNISEANATLIITNDPKSKGTALTLRECKAAGKPYLMVQMPSDPHQAAVRVAKWLTQGQYKVINVAGSRASKAPLAHNYTKQLLSAVIQLIAGKNPA